MTSVDEAKSWLAAHGVDVDLPKTREMALPRAGRGTASHDDADSTVIDADAGAHRDADAVGVAHTIALRKLTVRAQTRHELANALAAKQVPDHVATLVLERLQAAGLIDDAAFAADWVESRQQRRHLSASALRRELRAKGVDKEEIDDAVSEIDADAEYVAALDLARRRARGMSNLTREVQYRRLAGVLARRGFGQATTARVLSEVLD